MSRKNLQHIELEASQMEDDENLLMDKHSRLETLNEKPETFHTAEGISVFPSYSFADLKNVEHLNFIAGIAPNLRGPYSTMYVRRDRKSVV